MGNMVHDNKKFGADLYALEIVAKTDFPTVMGLYVDAIIKCDSVRADVPGAMWRPMEISGDTYGPVHDAYLGLHDTVVDFLRTTVDNLSATAKALDKAVQYFAATDQEAADEMNRHMREGSIPGGGR
ncbi:MULTISPECIES: hypothetical protein [unclassified Nocardia]|uniref:hypothetical protein n=1 Tax=unclassified Nocardia TaxID=2637762 RepID=UPI001CE445FC|nr:MULTISPECIES: hypothetical protein [unclassified Nocardia]